MTPKTNVPCSPDIVERLRSSEPLPVCPFDKLSPHYLTMPDDNPCPFCGQENTSEGPDKCRGADTRIMGEAADEIERLRGVAQVERRVSDDDWQRAVDCAMSCLKPPFHINRSEFDNAMQHAFGLLSLRRIPGVAPTDSPALSLQEGKTHD